VFTGLIRHQGWLVAREGQRLTVACPPLRAGLRLGDSVAVNGVCITAALLSADGFAADLLEATLRDTTLGELAVGSALNLEPALRAGDPLGGHFVQGHIDGTAELLSRDPLAGGSTRLGFSAPEWLKPWLIPKGSICVDGVSLTVQAIEPDSFTVELIPATLDSTNLKTLAPGQRVNLEADLIVKTVRALLGNISIGSRPLDDDD